MELIPILSNQASSAAVHLFILLHEKFDWLRVVVFQLNLKYLSVKITVFMALQNISHVAVQTNNSMVCT